MDTISNQSNPHFGTDKIGHHISQNFSRNKDGKRPLLTSVTQSKSEQARVKMICGSARFAHSHTRSISFSKERMCPENITLTIAMVSGTLMCAYYSILGSFEIS